MKAVRTDTSVAPSFCSAHDAESVKVLVAAFVSVSFRAVSMSSSASL